MFPMSISSRGGGGCTQSLPRLGSRTLSRQGFARCRPRRLAGRVLRLEPLRREPGAVSLTADERKRRSRILSCMKLFFANTLSTERLPPFWGKPFLDRFLGEAALAIFRIQQSPLPGGRICGTHIQARLRCAEPMPVPPAVPVTGANPT
jgi:hypothetical protein